MINSLLVSRPKLIWSFFFSLMFLLFLESMHVYFFWSIPFVIPGILSIFAIIFLFKESNYFSFSKGNIIPYLLFFVTLLYTKRGQNLNGFLGGILPFISLFLVFSLKIFYKAKFLDALTKTLSVLLAISLFAWILVMIGVNLPHTNIYYKSGERIFTLNCYFVFIEYTFDFIVFQRFMSVFIEPGYLAAVLVILIYINNFQLRRIEILILFISLIFTFSIAGYIMLAVAYISFMLRNRRYAIRYLLLSLFILGLTYNISIVANEGDNMLNELVLKRISLNEEGRLSGYNRTENKMDKMFIDFLKSSDLFSGIGSRYKQFGSNVGYKPFIVTNGIIGLILLLTSYFSGWYFTKTFSALTIAILFIMIFSKGHSEIFWAGYLMVYATSMYLPENWRSVYLE